MKNWIFQLVILIGVINKCLDQWFLNFWSQDFFILNHTYLFPLSSQSWGAVYDKVWFIKSVGNQVSPSVQDGFCFHSYINRWLAQVAVFNSWTN